MKVFNLSNSPLELAIKKFARRKRIIPSKPNFKVLIKDVIDLLIYNQFDAISLLNNHLEGKINNHKQVIADFCQAVLFLKNMGIKNEDILPLLDKPESLEVLNNFMTSLDISKLNIEEIRRFFAKQNVIKEEFEANDDISLHELIAFLRNDNRTTDNLVDIFEFALINMNQWKGNETQKEYLQIIITGILDPDQYHLDRARIILCDYRETMSKIVDNFNTLPKLDYKQISEMVTEFRQEVLKFLKSSENKYDLSDKSQAMSNMLKISKMHLLQNKDKSVNDKLIGESQNNGWCDYSNDKLDEYEIIR